MNVERDTLAVALDEARQRSVRLLAPLGDDALMVQHSPLMSPLVWDLAHVGNYEDQWLLRSVGAVGIGPELDDMYDAFRHPRPNRPMLPLLSPRDTRAYIDEVRAQVLDVLERVDLDGGGPLLRGGFVYGMVAQHEHQHHETMLATLQLMAAPGYRPDTPHPRGAEGREAVRGEALVPAGTYRVGTDLDPFAYDNERPAHVVSLAAFHIDVAPVTNAEYLGFIDAGGYDDPRLWSHDGWSWRQEANLAHPEFWARRDGEWVRDRFGVAEVVPPQQPVQHVCWYEAEAYARWAGKRLPTEAEWEVAATAELTTGATRRYPWGGDEPDRSRANLDGQRFSPAPVGSFPEGASPVGCHQMIGDVWEWTASDFAGYPGFVGFPYREYSEVFFGAGYKVLRGGSWATHRSMARATFRNWDFPIRRQIFAGFRCARDA